ncbi:hypothetical protein JCM9534A_52860 [Catenuloplanes indicus JCM 9534]|uniref:Alkanesulfonate monooxygenase SsuD/methylene tetrahydromethanopterin reductase-like flavin-dependent oxidoreductase (Luciferase family) n=2 Tax=Catenuloplanes indicus TaxID=137267 RepID=A0AAE3W2M3_9ACTN|nr:alkanesulfonate monooxygenase SsuD/methylene tetrahydromethanopterin reductase-like flavin-dependent oxidoreductase (luciferase family) [Catenuloplanes indicus]
MLRSSPAGGPFDFHGEHYRVERGGLRAPAGPAPPIYFGGASPAALEVDARHAGAYLLWGEPVPAVAARIVRFKNEAGRPVRIGLRVHVITQAIADEAWAEAARLLAGMSPKRIAATQTRFARMDSVGQARMARLHGGSTDGLTVALNLWAGVGLVREGAGTALVGSYDEAAARLDDHAAAGVDEFVLSAWPHLEEASRAGRHVLSRTRAGALTAVSAGKR